MFNQLLQLRFLAGEGTAFDAIQRLDLRAQRFPLFFFPDPGADRRLYLKILFDIVRKAVDVSGYQHQKSDDQQRHRDGRR